MTMKRQKELELLISRLQKAYYDGNPIVSDSEFDSLWEELKERFPNSELLSKVGSDTIKSNKVEHIMLMGSQNKVNTESDFEKWSDSIEYPVWVDFKMDGISIELQYAKEHLVDAVTRGDGYSGESVYQAIKNIPSVPKTIKVLDKNGVFAVRGELLISKDLFYKKYSDFKNPRNFVAGAIKNKDFKEYSDLSFIAYDVRDYDGFETEGLKKEWLSRNGFDVVETKKCLTCKDVFEYRNTINPYEQKFAIDGLVVKQHNCDVGDLKELRPKKQIAFKWIDGVKETEILNVEWEQNGTTFTPVAIMSPIEIEGTIVSRASLSNAGLVRSSGIMIGDVVEVSKRGMIIPKVERVVSHSEKSKSVEFPSVCPICGSKLVDDGTFIKCVNPNCDGVVSHRIAKWIDVLNIKGFGDVFRDWLVKKGGVSSIIYLYVNCNYVCENYTSQVNAIKAYDDLFVKSKSITLAQLIAGFDIEDIGIETSNLIVSELNLKTIDDLQSITMNQLMLISGLGEVKADSFFRGIKEHFEEMKELIARDYVSIKSENIEIIETSLSGKRICVTGKLNHFSRSEIEDTIKKYGGISVSSVSKTTDYLLTNDPNSGSSKNVNAKKFNIPVISEEEFEEMCK